ncbi:MAG: hypothetical protein JWQ98_3173 [Chlorobi bacterium]|nr:hypothetical protein [Chlorobiota bacterium]
MRLFIFTCAIALLFITSAWAQGAGDAPRHPEEPDAVSAGTFSISLGTVIPDLSSSPSISTDENKNRVSGYITVFNVSSGGTDYLVPVDSLHFIGDGGDIDNISTIEFFDEFAQAVVSQGVAQGYMACPASCSVPKTSRVYLASCVQRTGQGGTTHFAPCDATVFCYREYSVCCPNGVATPTLTKIIHEGTSCSPGSQCEPTCP